VTAAEIRQKGAEWRTRPDWLLSGRHTTSHGRREVPTHCIPSNTMLLSFCLFPLCVKSGHSVTSGRLGLVVTEGSKVPIWKALSINGLRHGVRSNLLIL